MAFLEKIQFLLKSIFSPNDPEFIKEQKIKSLEIELQRKNPNVYKKGFVQSCIPEYFFELHKNIDFFREILEFIQIPERVLAKKRIYDALIYTGFDTNTRNNAQLLNFEHRKSMLETKLYSKHEFAQQEKAFEEIQKNLKSDIFVQIEESIRNLELFYDLCSYQYIDMLKNFNSSFTFADQNPHFIPQKCEALLEDFLNFYYVSANVKITGSLARAIMATVSIIPGDSNKITEEVVVKKLKKIATIINKLLTKDLIKILATIGNNGEEPELQIAESNVEIIKDFIERQKTLFDADTSRLLLEHENNMRLSEIQMLFDNRPLVSLNGYNDETNLLLQNGTPYTLQYMQPLKIVKTFYSLYITDEVKAFLNDLVVEGDFSIPAEKSDFSAVIYNALEIESKIDEFEKQFNTGAIFDRKILVSYINTSKVNHDSAKLLGNMITDANLLAKELISEITSILFLLHLELKKVFDDARKINPGFITNVRMLLASLRNKEAKDTLERNMDKWKEFFNIMKHYTEIKIKNSQKESV